MYASFLVRLLVPVLLVFLPLSTEAGYHFSDFHGTPPIHILAGTSKTPVGLTPEDVRAVYHLPSIGGHGTIVIIGAYDDSSIEKDLQTFSGAFGLPDCTSANNCLLKHPMASTMRSDAGWTLETTLDVEWAHAIAPNARILLVEAATPSGTNLIKAVDYAASLEAVSAISMSWGGREFPEEISLDSHFISVSHAPFFASSGDSGAGASWPAASPNVIGVGGTLLTFSSPGVLQRETAWSGSGGGVSQYEKQPAYQATYSIPNARSMRAIPDVSYGADPASGFAIVHDGIWRRVGGTSAGAPQWAAIAALGSGVNAARLYHDKESSTPETYFRDVVSGRNGSCTYYCVARAHYDYVTGLGSPQTIKF